MTTADKIKASLIAQLEAQKKTDSYFMDLVETYMAHWKLKESLIADIEKNGIRVTLQTGNGHDKEIANPSVMDLQRETSVMLSILDKLELKTPVVASGNGDYL